MLTFFLVLGTLLVINVFIFIFSRNKVEEASAPKNRKVTYEEEVRTVNPTTTPQVQDA